MWRAVPLLLVIAASSVQAAGRFDGSVYRPYAHPFPQIIQNGDYPTIQAIESLRRTLGRHADASIPCDVAMRAIRLNQSPAAGVEIGRRWFTSQLTISLYSTLKHLVADLSAKRACAGARIDQFATRAYRRRTVIEFDFGDDVITLDAMSNGRTNQERLYILDVVPRSESYFWGFTPASDG